MQYVDARQPPAGPATARPEMWLGEPDAQLDVRTPDDLFGTLARELSAAEVVRVVGREWLADEGLAREVERLPTAFVSRGGRVERD